MAFSRLIRTYSTKNSIWKTTHTYSFNIRSVEKCSQCPLTLAGRFVCVVECYIVIIERGEYLGIRITPNIFTTNKAKQTMI